MVVFIYFICRLIWSDRNLFLSSLGMFRRVICGLIIYELNFSVNILGELMDLLVIFFIVLKYLFFL